MFGIVGRYAILESSPQISRHVVTDRHTHGPTDRHGPSYKPTIFDWGLTISLVGTGGGTTGSVIVSRVTNGG